MIVLWWQLVILTKIGTSNVLFAEDEVNFRVRMDSNDCEVRGLPISTDAN